MLVRRTFNRADAGSYTSLHNLAPQYQRPPRGYQLPRDLLSTLNEDKSVKDPRANGRFDGIQWQILIAVGRVAPELREITAPASEIDVANTPSTSPYKKVS
ncbi:hypothetical protein EVAR_21717_1 [Eumeta japonica]|uniref:Uncharacterized protein n=1 Tax=Eumeta variegata TaxID=151549 RepID=A0A4C1W669_EUMVA|nr:hypothetical protein EVAR_21717_1 [Eumeta japonica]